jgi:hypothetical protein
MRSSFEYLDRSVFADLETLCGENDVGDKPCVPLLPETRFVTRTWV